MASKNYYFCPQNQFYFCFEWTDENQPRLAVHSSKDTEWKDWPVKAARFLADENYYKLSSPDIQSSAYLRIPTTPDDKPCLIFKKKHAPNDKQDKLFYLDKIDNPIFQSEAEFTQNDTASMVSPNESFEIQPSIQIEPPSAINPIRYSLSDNQRKALEDHKAKLQNRRYEYRILSYFFKTGYSKTEKIREITHLLEGQDIDSDILSQGRTGKILKGSGAVRSHY